MERRPRLSETVCDTLDDIKEKYGYKDDESAIRHLIRESGYDE